MRRFGFLALVFCNALAAVAQLPAARGAMVDREIRALEFVCGSPLNPREKQTAARVVDSGMRADPAGWKQADAETAQALRLIASGNAASNNALRRQWRSVYVFQPEKLVDPTGYALERQIIEAHDPVLAVDRARKLVVTRQALPLMRQVAAWVAATYHVAPPSAGFDSLVADHLRSALPHMSAKDAELYADFEEHAAYAAPFYNRSSPALRATLQKAGKTDLLRGAENPAVAQWNLLSLGSTLAAAGAQRADTIAHAQANWNRMSEAAMQAQKQANMARVLRGAIP